LPFLLSLSVLFRSSLLSCFPFILFIFCVLSSSFLSSPLLIILSVCLYNLPFFFFSLIHSSCPSREIPSLVGCDVHLWYLNLFFLQVLFLLCLFPLSHLTFLDSRVRLQTHITNGNITVPGMVAMVTLWKRETAQAHQQSQRPEDHPSGPPNLSESTTPTRQTSPVSQHVSSYKVWVVTFSRQWILGLWYLCQWLSQFQRNLLPPSSS
jgi:hypothetical protein